MSMPARQPLPVRLGLVNLMFGITCLLLAAVPVQAQERRDPHGPRETAPSRPATPDTSVMTGDGLNNLGGPIFRKIAEGTFRKDPGSRIWTKMEIVTREQMREQRQQLRQQRLVREGDKPLSVVVEVRDTTERTALSKFGIAITEAPPCTAKVRVLYRQLDSLKQRGTILWLPGQRRPGSAPEPGKSLELGMPGPSPRPSQSSRPEGGGSINSVTIWSDSFETFAVPGSNWTCYDTDANEGSDYWGSHTSGCGYVFGGSFSVHCAYIGDAPCFQYAPSQVAEMDQIPTVNISGYPSVAVQLSANYQILDDTYDVFNVWLDTGSGFALFDTRYGNSGGWIPLTYFLSGFSSLKIAFEFLSDDIVQSGYGVYLDNVSVVGTQANLTYHTPLGWAGPIVPSNVTGITSVGTLYVGEPVYLDWAITNNGDASTSNTFYVDFLVYDTNGSTILVHDYRSVFGLAQGAADVRQDNLSFTVNSAGTHKIRMVVDSLPTSQVVESDETPSDNGVTRTYTWVTRPDLVIDNVTVTPPSPLVGQAVDIAVTVRNNGTENISTTFYVELYQDPTSPPPPPSPPPGDANIPVFGLNANASTTVHFSRTSQFATTWHMYLYVDRTNVVQEAPASSSCPSNECNNRYGPSNVLWNPGNLIVSGKLAYDDSLGGTNRPIKCAVVKIYDQDLGGTDDPMQTTFTDELGNFSVGLVNDDDDVDHGLLDIYVVAEFATSASCRGSEGVVLLDAVGNRWSMQSPVVANAANGTLNFLTLKPVDSPRRRALHIYHTLLRGYDWVVAQGSTPSTVSVKWYPGHLSPTSYDSVLTQIAVNSKVGLSSMQTYSGPDDYVDYAMLHEYGHHVAYVFNITRFTPGAVSWAEGVEPPYAWREAWPEWFASQTVAAAPTAVLRDWAQYSNVPSDTSVYTLNLETGVLSFSGSTTDPPSSADANQLGEYTRGGICSALWDLSDLPNDNQPPNLCGDELSDPVSRTWLTSIDHLTSPMNQLCDFRNLYFKRFILGSATAIGHFNRTFCEHGVVCGGTLGVSAEAGSLALSPVWPNPSRRTSGVRCYIPSDVAGGRVSLEVFDVMGARMRTLFEGVSSSGEMNVKWDGRSESGTPCSAGIYFVRLRAGGQQLTTSLVRLE